MSDLTSTGSDFILRYEMGERTAFPAAYVCSNCRQEFRIPSGSAHRPAMFALKMLTFSHDLCPNCRKYIAHIDCGQDEYKFGLKDKIELALFKRRYGRKE